MTARTHLLATIRTTMRVPPGVQHAESSADPHPFAVHAGTRRLGLLLLGVHLTVLLWVTLRSTPSGWLADSNLTPFASVHAELAAGTGRAWLELLGGLLPLAPLGVLLPLAGGRRDAPLLGSFTRTLLAGGLAATGLEVLQTTLSLRLLNVDDILLACIGIALSHLAAVPAARAWLRRRAVAPAPGTARAPETDPESAPENRALRNPGPGRVRIIGRADGTALPAREA
ncbi:VanZ like family protein [Streptacidiphilus jiangxiensis]|uniref:VanZ like family protein n=1 Tax=Streptacidiphilus jiangxiensis TaxID=235985 RepID=A0A1H7ME94_STRJI|nr:VanZ like family protein [Streptacidiphilus jiangxiensis]